MPVIALPIFVFVCAVVLSVLALRQRRWPALRLAVVLGWLGPLPGYLSVMGVGLGEPRGLGWLLLYYVSFAVPMFGSYCFGAGLLGGALLGRYTVEPSPSWVRPVAVVAFAAAAAAPVMLLFKDSPLALAAAVSAFCCAAGMLLFRRRIFAAS
jgi:hypothetical protein